MRREKERRQRSCWLGLRMMCEWRRYCGGRAHALMAVPWSETTLLGWDIASDARKGHTLQNCWTRPKPPPASSDAGVLALTEEKWRRSSVTTPRHLTTFLHAARCGDGGCRRGCARGRGACSCGWVPPAIWAPSPLSRTSVGGLVKRRVEAEGFVMHDGECIDCETCARRWARCTQDAASVGNEAAPPVGESRDGSPVRQRHGAEIMWMTGGVRSRYTTQLRLLCSAVSFKDTLHGQQEQHGQHEQRGLTGQSAMHTGCVCCGQIGCVDVIGHVFGLLGKVGRGDILQCPYYLDEQSSGVLEALGG